MKKLFILLLYLFVQNISFAQDIIYKTDGNEIKAKVIEIEESVIKYKNFDQQEGPIRSISKSQVFMIKYQDGTTEKFTTIVNLKPGSVLDTTKENKLTTAEEIDLQIEKAKVMKGIGLFLFIPGATCLAASVLTFALTEKNSNILICISVPFVISGVIVTSIGQSRLNSSKKRKAKLGFQMVPFDNFNNGKIISTQAISLGIRISF